MKIINQNDIDVLGIDNTEILAWVRDVFLQKDKCDLPHKISQTFMEGKAFYNTMPAIIPMIDTYGVKVVSRYPMRSPSIQADMLLYSYKSGELLCKIDASWITSKRTGAVAALAVDTFARDNASSIALIGFGQTGYAFVDMLLSMDNYSDKIFKLKAYKGKELDMKKYLISRGVSKIEICQTNKELICNSDIIVSAVTVAETLFAEDSWFKEGVLVIPIHTRGFQNCDLFFDRIFADDTAHVSDFKNFKNFKNFNEFKDVLSKNIKPRSSQFERVLAYNIGIALHDVYLARKIYDLMGSRLS